MNNSLHSYILQLADTSLILSHRNSEWCGHGPVLEQDIALTNIALDLLGQARNFYQYAATAIPGSDEDKLAYLRDAREFKNILLAELPNGDWAVTTLRQFYISTYQFSLFSLLQHGTDKQVAAICSKAIKELAYHIRWSSEWVIRLGDGTEESHQRMLQAIDILWPYTGEMFVPASYEKEALQQLQVNASSLQANWLQQVKNIFEEATLTVPPEKAFMHTGGKNGLHTEHLGYILADMQFLQRAYPNSVW